MSARELITEHLDLWTGAVTHKSSVGRGSNGKIELTGIKKLRELILELAVRGKLVEQDPRDEPASVLLERIAEEKARLVKEGKIKKPKKPPEITEEEKPFELPKGWQWARLSDVLRVINGRAYKKHEMLQDGTPLLRVGNLFTSNEWYYSDLQLEDDKYIDHGDLIYAWSASFGPFIWDGGRAIYHYHIWKLELFDYLSTSKHFLYNYLKAVTEEIKSSGSGIAMIHMTKAKMDELVVPLPPLEEQLRIVEKVDELMALCNRLEQQVGDQLEAHEVLVDTLLGVLTCSKDPAELAESWARIAKHFDKLFTTEDSIEKLKQTILQLAVMGRLVAQDPNDEPASVLLEKIAEEKTRLVKEGKIKKSKELPENTDEEKPFGLPEGWEWTRLSDVLRVINGRAYKKHEMLQEGTPLLRVGNLFTSNEWYYSDLELDDDKYIDHGDLIYAWSASFGPFIWDGERAIYHYHIWKLDLYDNSITDKKFIYNYLKSVTEKIKASGNGIAMIHMTKAKMEEIIVPFPPLKEQQRIVEKIDELMALCNQLKTNLGKAGETRVHLADAVVENFVQ
ncbi:restriction endonuclease subunit S [Halomonas rhizosphaerae]|uniref:Restriction endonuclease subunit S n=1 Tax=Halomonas rhizosphaerae TaxID=3043296 RepID=A0ABT6UYN4_9GAMM|nr:restriction endonuclease subunit S [Halomonas rhizosphaerae]MDI5891090.1 restriction endonuclease subunit S [Halomonas rhizosphaerae]